MIESLSAWWGVAAGVVAGAIGYGKTQKTVSNNEDKIKKFEDKFTDSDGNPRLMSVVQHSQYCNKQQELTQTMLSSLHEKIDANHRAHCDTRSKVSEIAKTVAVMAEKIDNFTRRDR